jgi:heat shock protein HslJ
MAQPPLYGDWELTKMIKDGAEMALAPGGKTPTIKFSKEGFNGTGGCNGYAGSYTTAAGGKWTVGPVRSTKMACMGGVNVQEAAYFEILGKTTQYRMSKGSLLLTDSGGNNSLTFRYKAPETPATKVEAPAEPREKTFLWIVDKQRVDCRGIVRQNCLQVKETDAAEWQILRESIAGFKYKPGKYYLIRVKRILKTSAMANAPVFDYKLVRVISRTRKMPHVD